MAHSSSFSWLVCSIDLKYYEILQFNFCCFSSVTFGHYNSWSTIVFFIIIFAVFLPNDDSDIIFQSSLLFHPWKESVHWKLKLWVVWLRNFESSNLTFDLQRSTQVKIVLLFESPYYSFLTNFYWHFLYRSVFQTSESSIDTFSLSRTVFEIFDFKVFRVWPLTFKGYLRSKLFSPFESPYMISYLTSMTLPVNLIHFSRYLTSNFLSFDVDFRHSDVTWGQKYFHYSKAHTWLPI